MQDWPINSAGVALVKDFESFVGHAYPDPMSPLGKALQARGLWKRVLSEPGGIPDDLQRLSGSPWTLGWGFTRGVVEGDTISLADADRRLRDELAETLRGVLVACQIVPNENQLAAFVSCAFNVGPSGFKGSTMLKAHNRGDFPAASRAFRLWNKSRGVEVPGLTRRRLAESTLYMRPVQGRFDPDEELMPQRVDPESSLIRSPIIAGSLVSGATGTLGLVGDASRTLGDMKYSLGDWLPYVLVAVLLLGVGYAIAYRVLQRKRGFV